MNELAGMFMLLNEGGWLAEKKKKKCWVGGSCGGTGWDCLAAG